MDTEVLDRSADHPWSLSRVTGHNLDPGKYWYVLTKSLCGIRPNAFAKNEIFRRFPDEIRSVPPGDLKPATRDSAFNTRQPNNLYVVSTFGLCAALLRQREFPGDGFVSSEKIIPVVDAVNRIALDCEMPDSLGGKSDELQKCQSRIAELELEIREQKKNEEHLNSFLPSSPPLAASSPSCSQKSNENSSDSNDISSSSNSSAIEEALRSPLGPTLKKRRVASECKKVSTEVDGVLAKYHETLACILGNSFLYGADEEKGKVSETISEVVNLVIDAKGPKKGVTELLLPTTYQRLLESMRVPDWVLLYFKLQAKLPDAAWQTLLNLTQLGRSGRASDTAVLLTKNEIRALKKLVFKVVRTTLSIQKMNTDFHSCGVDLASVLVWAIREQRLYSSDTVDMEFNIKLDGRPLGGRSQVAIGLVPINFEHKSSESALSVYPVAIANCKEKRGYLKQLVSNLNAQKDKIKKSGITVDGKKYHIKFTVTLDYKALLLLLQKGDDENFILGGKGYDEFCAFCDAIRGCTCHGVEPDETCLDCLRSKANIGRSTGLRDDLTFLLEEDLSNINLCSLHCEMRNCEQLLGSLGLFAHRVGSLDALNEALSDHGPESCKGIPRVTVKEKPGQQTEVERRNIKVASFSGSFEREVLKHFDTIVEKSLPMNKVIDYYKQSPGSGKQLILDFVTFFEEQKMYINNMLECGEITRDYGVEQKTATIEKNSDFENFLLSRRDEWETKQKEVEAKFLELCSLSDKQEAVRVVSKKRKRTATSDSHPKVEQDPFATYAAEIQVSFFRKVCSDWRDIALTIRDKVFTEDEEQLIDIHDVKCKEWGFLLKKLFGMHLGTGDYGHLVIDHSAMLLRHFRSLYKYSGQGFEASHKLHRNLYSKATNHDSSAPGQSLDQILTHWFSTMLLSLRYTFREAKNCIVFGKKKFSFRGCGWKAINTANWNKEKQDWILAIDDLFTQLFGEDFLRYVYDKDKGTSVDEHILSTFTDYNHDQWEGVYSNQEIATQPDTPANPKHPTSHKGPKRMFSGSRNSLKEKVVLLDDEDNTDEEISPSNGSERQPPSATRMGSTRVDIITQVAGAAQQDTPVKGHGTKRSTCVSHKAPKRMFIGSETFKEKVILLDDEDGVDEEIIPSDGSGQHLSFALTKASTRAELAALATLIPPVSSAGGSLSLVLGHAAGRDSAVFTNPFSIVQRPCQAVIERAETLLIDERDKGNNVLGVVIPGLGQFSKQGLRILKKFCTISETKRKVTAEAKWLAELNCTQGEFELLQSALWNKPTTSAILACDHKSIDVLSFSDLVEERYIDSFVIDVSISKYIEESYSQGQEFTLYLPTEFFQWMQVPDKEFKVRKLKERASQIALFDNVCQMLVPVFMVNHWGLIYVNFTSKQLYFDDGLTSVVPPVALPFVKDTLGLLLELCPHHLSLQTKFWHSIQGFRRFGMPSQLPVDNRMIGVGSCGIGVIMAARDFIRNGPAAVNNIMWRYSNMHNHRKELMLQILRWAGYDA